jgi:hypothetical protein
LEIVLIFSEPVNLINPENFLLVLKVGAESEVLVPESVTLDSTSKRVVFKLKITKSVDNGVIEISTKPNTLVVQSKSNP